MYLDHLRRCLESLDESRPILHECGLRDVEQGWRNLRHISQAIGLDVLFEVYHPLVRALPRTPDPDMALNSLERLLAHAGFIEQLPVLLEDRGQVLETVLQLFSTSQYFSDLLAANPDYLEMLRVPLRMSPSEAELREQLQREVDAAFEDSAVLRVFRRYRQRQILRIGSNDIIRDRPLEEVTRDISRVADVALDVALSTAIRHIGNRFGQPFTTFGAPAACSILAFGKLGGAELNYSSDIDLMFIYDEEGATRGKRTSIDNSEFFGRVVTEVVRLLSAHTDRGQAYRVDLRLRPEGQRGPLARSLASTLSYYDTLGRTWERQALIKVRPAAGDHQLGQSFLRLIEPFVYRKYLTFAEINEIKALKRRIEQKTGKSGGTERDVKTGHGGIRDIEFAIQFLQLLNGGDLPEVRERTTLTAMQALAAVGCLTDQEYTILEQAYRFLRKTEHRLQLLFDLQTHSLPDRPDELQKLARRMGYGTLTAFLHDYREQTDLNRKILDHLLHQTFEGEAGQAEPESDLLLEPHPEPETIQAVLGRYPFRDVQGAYHSLTQLAQESVPFLSTRRCRHFLASIAPRLLRALAETPDPDMALVNLEKVTASLGAKAVLWELFSLNQPSLKLYVDLCAGSQFLSEILISNPGMIDDLLDSLVLDQPRTADELRAELADLCKGATEPEPILHSFQDKELLRIGVRDILGKDTIRETTATLSDLAETILVQIAQLQEPALVRRFGVPLLAESGERKAESEEREAKSVSVSRYVLLGLGKLGGREMSYHSDLDLILVYEGDGRTARTAPLGSRSDEEVPRLTGAASGQQPRAGFSEATDNFHFFTELAQRIIKAASFQGPMGRLYEVDMRLRPTGKSGSLVIPLEEFRRYYDEGHAQLWERQALTRARIVHGDAAFGREVMQTVERGAFGLDWQPEFAEEIEEMRARIEASRGPRNVKRGYGGFMDIEFLVQLFQLKYARSQPALRTPNTWQALDALQTTGLISKEEYTVLQTSYDFLRLVEGRLRIVHNRARNDLPESPEDLENLARRTLLRSWPDADASGNGQSAGQRLLAELDRHMSQTRKLFLRIVARERA